MPTASGQALLPYVPRISAEWPLDAPGQTWRSLDACLVLVDVSGFTALSERLARKGRIGAEQLTDILGDVFGTMLDLAYARGGALLKFGGDALLLMFRGADQEVQACAAAVEMRRALSSFSGSPGAAGRVQLRMSVGIHRGPVDFFRVGTSHDELLIAGPTATETTAIEGVAQAGEILVSDAVRRALPGSATRPTGPHWALRWRQPQAPAAGPAPPRRRVDPTHVLHAVPLALRSFLGQGAAEPEHRNASIAFVKFSGVDGILAANGPDEAARCIAEVVDTVQAAADREDVTFLGTDISDDGAKIILATGVPALQEDDEGRILRSARAILDAPGTLPVRVGVNRGHVFAGEIGASYRRTYTVMGDTVNLAARLLAKAHPGQLVATPDILDRSRTIFATEGLPPFMVKGKSQPINAYAVGPETGTRSRRGPAELPFGGRRRELAILADTLAADDPPFRPVVTLEGPTGIGKTRLVDEALGRLGPDPRRVVRIRAEAYLATSPYHALRDPIRSLVGVEAGSTERMARDLHDAMRTLAPDRAALAGLVAPVVHVDLPETPELASIEPRFRPARTADLLIELQRRASPAGLIVVIEDGHWLDDASSFVVREIARAAGAERWVVLASRRPGPGGLALDSGATIELGPLSRGEAEQVAIAATAAAPLRPSDLDRIVDRSGGNPLFLDELVQAVRTSGSTDSLPDSLDAIVGSEIDRLETLPRRFLRYASVLGLSFRTAVIEEVLADEEAALDSATVGTLARFLEPDGPGRWRFRHALQRDVAYEGLSFRRRRELHMKAAEVIERTARPNADTMADALSRHYAAAGMAEPAWHYARIAGERALAAFANHEAAAHFERALGTARRVDGVTAADRARVLTQLGDAREQAGHFGEALDAYRRASRLVDDPVILGDLYVKRARARMPAGAFGSALADTARGLRLLDGIDSLAATRARARLRSFRAGVRMTQQRPREAIVLAAAAGEEAHASGEEESLARCHLIMDWAHRALGEPGSATGSLLALEICERIGELGQAANIRNNLGGYAYFDGEWDQALQHYEGARTTYRRAGNVIGAAVAASNIGEVLVSQGKVAEARPVLEDAIRVLRGSGVVDDTFFAEIQFGRMLLAEGSLPEALEYLAELKVRAADIDQPWSALEIALYRAEALAGLGDTDRAAEILDDALVAGSEYTAFFGAAIAHARAFTQLHGDRMEGIPELIAEGLLDAERQGLTFERLRLLRLRGEYLLRVGGTPDPEEAALIDRIRRDLGIVDPAPAR